MPVHKIRGECQVILAQHLGGLPWEHRVRYAKDAEVRAACRPEVFVVGKAQSIGTPSAGQLHRAQSATSAWGVYWPCDSRSRAACVLGSAAGPKADGLAKTAERRGRRSQRCKLTVN